MSYGESRTDGGDGPHGLRPLLKPAQDRVLAALADGEAEEFTRSTYEEIAHVSRSQAAYDLADLVKLGLVERLGAGRATRYRIAREGDGRRRKWTPARIRDELERFCGERGRWPRAAEFREAGLGGLYLAASRYGGIDHWAAELGFYEPAPASSSGRGDVALGRRSDGGLLLAALAALFVLGVVLIVQLMPANPSASTEAQMVGVARERVDAVPDAVPARRSLDANPAAELVALRLAATGGGSSIVARRGSADGRLLWKGTLEVGDSLRLRGKAIWLRIGTPANLAARVDGDLARIPPRARTVRVTAGGIRVLDRRPAPQTVLAVEAQPVAAVSAPAPSSPESPAPAAPVQPDPPAVPAPDPAPPGPSLPAPDPAPPRP